MDLINYADFEKVELRIGSIVAVEEFTKAHNPSYKVKIDLGELGVKKSSAQITELYSTEELMGRQVVVVCNFPTKQIADYMSECLILGVVGSNDGVVLLSAEREVKNGSRVL